MVRTKFDARLVDETRFRHDLEECRGTPDGESLKIEKKRVLVRRVSRAGRGKDELFHGIPSEQNY